jgi:glutamate dehydrogenase (NAD(P)+)
MTHGQHMIWMLDELERIRGGKFPGFITGKPVGMGGSLGRTEATGYGVMYTVREAMKELGIDIRMTKAAFQGFGNVSQYAVRLFKEYGGTPILVACWDQHDQTSYTFRRMSGIDPDELVAITDKFGTIDKDKARKAGYEVLPGEAWIEQDVDLLVPAALENQVTGGNAAKIHKNVKIVAEGANGPTTPEADAIIRERGIFMIPDFLCNAGGVTCSYFEQVQCNMNYFWTREEVLTRLDEKMTAGFKAVSELARKKNVGMRDAAYMIAIARVADACRLRGWV